MWQKRQTVERGFSYISNSLRCEMYQWVVKSFYRSLLRQASSSQGRNRSCVEYSPFSGDTSSKTRAGEFDESSQASVANLLYRIQPISAKLAPAMTPHDSIEGFNASAIPSPISDVLGGSAHNAVPRRRAVNGLVTKAGGDGENSPEYFPPLMMQRKLVRHFARSIDRSLPPPGLIRRSADISCGSLCLSAYATRLWADP